MSRILGCREAQAIIQSKSDRHSSIFLEAPNDIVFMSAGMRFSPWLPFVLAAQQAAAERVSPGTTKRLIRGKESGAIPVSGHRDGKS